MASSRTRVVNRRWTQDYDVYVGRGSIFGNPFTHLYSSLRTFRIPDANGELTTVPVVTVTSREEAIERYRAWVVQQPGILRQIPKLKGKVLACYCVPEACHAQVLAEMADAA